MSTALEVVVSGDGIIEINDHAHALKMAAVSSKNARGLQWNHSGVYVLLGEWTDGGWCAYVGKANELSIRIAQPHPHIEWNRALLVCRPQSHFNAAEALWLERRLTRPASASRR